MKRLWQWMIATDKLSLGSLFMTEIRFTLTWPVNTCKTGLLYLIVLFKENFNLIDALMLAARSKEVVYVDEEIQRFHSGLKNAEKKWEEEFEQLLKSEDLFMQGKAFIVESNIIIIRCLLLDYQLFSSCETTSPAFQFRQIDEWCSVKMVRCYALK